MKQTLKNFFNKIGAGMRKVFGVFKKNGDKHKTHSVFGAIVAFQYRDKVDLSWTKTTKTRIQKIIFSILKFIIVAAVVFAILMIIKELFKITTQILSFYLVFLGVYSILNLITVTFGLVKSLYYAEDNKVLVTFPVKSSQLFISKIVVYELFELRKSLDILIPVSLAFFISAIGSGVMQVGTIFWSIIPMLLLITGTVLLGALLSIPALYIYKTLKNHAIIEAIVFLLVVAAIATGIVLLIGLIPENKGDVDIIRSFPLIKSAIDNFVGKFSTYVAPITYIFKSMVGDLGSTWIGYKLVGMTFAYTAIILAIVAALAVLVVLVIKPFYFSMLTKTFEFNKKIMDKPKPNKVRNKHFTFVVKEIKLTLREFELSGSYLIVYLAVPILLYFIDKVFAAMTTSTQGNFLILTFNILLIILPLLASSSLFATLYSREGRTAYMKKTKPIRPYFPLFSKMITNFVLVVPTIIVSCVIFKKFCDVSTLCTVLLAIAVFFLQYGHMFFSATLDIMNPQNEVYATEGTSISNPNEIKSTVVAFVTAILIALVGYVFLTESHYANGNLNSAFIKILIISAVFFGSAMLLFFLKIKAFYIDRQEASRE